MKKTLMSLTFIAGFSMLCVGNASAAGGLGEFKGTTTTVLGGANFRASTGVILIAKTQATAPATSFSVGSKHTSGDLIYTATSVQPSVVSLAKNTSKAVGYELDDTDVPVAP